VLRGGRLLLATLSSGSSEWGEPKAVSPADRTVLAAKFSPNSSAIAVAVAGVAVPAPSLSWEIVDEVIIDVINKVACMLIRVSTAQHAQTPVVTDIDLDQHCL
jgi:hypothetical protein